MDFECTKVGEAMVLAPKGSINTESSPKLEKKLVELQAASERRLVVDFRHIDYISSAGLRVLLMTARRVKMAGGALALCSMNAGVTKVFALCGFERDFTIVATCDEAIARVNAAKASPTTTAARAPAAVAPLPAPQQPPEPAQRAAAPAPVPVAVPEAAAAPVAVALPEAAPLPRPVEPAAATSPAVVDEALRALSAGLAPPPRIHASVAPELVERARKALAQV